MSGEVQISASILNADFGRLFDEVRRADAGGVDSLHLDVMDGHFVDNITFGPGVIAALRPMSRLPFHSHLMISQPLRYARRFAEAGSDLLIFHVEADDDPDAVIDAIEAAGKRPGLALNPETPASAVHRYLERIDLLLVMTVNPGFGGQRFIHSMLPKIQRAHHLLQQCNAHCELEVDGGVDLQTAPLAVHVGADVLVAGTAIFADKDGPKAGLLRLMQAI
jgi:ribulose-phosphate 3-epimerase